MVKRFGIWYDELGKGNTQKERISSANQKIMARLLNDDYLRKVGVVYMAESVKNLIEIEKANNDVDERVDSGPTTTDEARKILN